MSRVVQLVCLGREQGREFSSEWGSPLSTGTYRGVPRIMQTCWGGGEVSHLNPHLTQFSLNILLTFHGLSHFSLQLRFCNKSHQTQRALLRSPARTEAIREPGDEEGQESQQ